MQIDVGKYRATGEIDIDRPLARYAAWQYVEGLGGLEATIDVGGRAVLATVRRDVPLSFLQLVGLSSAAISATASAEPYHGIEYGRP